MRPHGTRAVSGNPRFDWIKSLQTRGARHRAHLSNAEHIEDGRLVQVQGDVQDTYGPTVTEAMRALDASFETWRREHPPGR